MPRQHDIAEVRSITSLARDIFGPQTRLFQMGPLYACHHDGRMYGFDSDCFYLIVPELRGFVSDGFSFVLVACPIRTQADIRSALALFERLYLQPQIDALAAEIGEQGAAASTSLASRWRPDTAATWDQRTVTRPA